MLMTSSHSKALHVLTGDPIYKLVKKDNGEFRCHIATWEAGEGTDKLGRPVEIKETKPPPPCYLLGDTDGLPRPPFRRKWGEDESNPSVTSRCGSQPAALRFLLTCALLMTSSHSEGRSRLRSGCRYTSQDTPLKKIKSFTLSKNTRGGKGRWAQAPTGRTKATERRKSRAGRKSPLATENLLEDTDGLRRPPLEGGATQSISDLSMR